MNIFRVSNVDNVSGSDLEPQGRNATLVERTVDIRLGCEKPVAGAETGTPLGES
jgi:hypothetical protein